MTTKQTQVVVPPKEISTPTESTFSFEADYPTPDRPALHTLHLRFSDWKYTKARITDTQTETLVYDADFRIRKPHIVVKSNDVNIGTSVMHYFKSRIDVDINGQAIQLIPKKRLSCKYCYASPALQNSTVTWTTSWGLTNFSLVCLDQSSLPIARVTHKCSWSMKELGKIEFMDDRALKTAVRDEVVVTGLSLMYSMICINNATFGAAGAAGAVGGSGA